MVQFGVFSIYRSFAFLYGDSSDGDEATPLFHSMPENLGKAQLKSKHQEVIDIVINSFPEPDHNTSWEQILDFRADPGSATKLLRLRNWIREMSHGELAHYEIKEKLEWALHEYEEHLRIHKIKTANSVLRTMIVGTAEAVENILKLKLKDAANLLFFARERHVAFLQAEAEAPGRELAYVYSARQRFCK